MKDLNFIPECYVDTNLVETLMNVDVNHQHSCSKVAHTMEHTKTDSFAVGIIDNDKKKPTYVSSFTLIASKEHFKLLKHQDRHHYLIIISPAIDRFIIDCAQKSNINLEDYGLPHNFNNFKEQTKKITSNKDTRFKALFNALKINDEFACLEKVLTYLRKQQYKSSISDLEQLFLNK